MKNTPIVQYQTEGGFVMLEVHLNDETVWLSQKHKGLLFDRDYKTVSKPIRNVFKEGELEEKATVAKFATVQMEGEREVVREIDYYNLDVIISVGYRVKSKRGTNFRIWATQVLRKHLITQVNRLKANASYQEKYIELVKAIDAAASINAARYPPHAQADRMVRRQRASKVATRRAIAVNSAGDAASGWRTE